MPAGRPFEEVPAPRALPPCDPVSVAPLNHDGFPDLMNYLPTRLVPLDEAKQRGWPLFYQAEPCRYGHTAPRYVSNPRQCVDCFRAKRGKQLISAAPVAGRAEYKRPYKQREVPTTPAPTQIVAAAPLEPDRMEKRFLAEYAAHKDIHAAAVGAGMTAAQVIARMSWSKVFADAVRELEIRQGIKAVPALTGPYVWTDDKHERFIEVYVDTGDMATARDAIQVTPSEYFREVERNSDFSSRVDEATPLALKALEERATQLALAGNDKLLTKILSAKLPEYRERVNIDLNTTEKLSDDQLNAQLLRLTNKYQGRVFDGEFVEVEPQRKIEAPRNVEGDGPASEPEPNSDLL